MPDMSSRTPPIAWRKSSRSTGNGAACVEVAPAPAGGVIFIRDSQDPSGPVLSCNNAQWESFITGTKKAATDFMR